MKAYVVYDSAYGNTEKIARSIGGALGPPTEATVIRVGEINPEELTGIDLLIVGSPTQKFNPTPAISNWLKSLPKGSLKGIRAAAFDTRFTEEEINKVRVLAFMVNIFGYAAEPIADRLKNKGAELVLDPEGFYVSDTEGPLLKLELDRAALWAGSLLK